MAALPEARTPELLALTQVRVADLDPLLQEEARNWRESLDWDFQSSADLVRRFVDLHALSGYALFVDRQCAGYAYYVCEDHKGLIGDVYVRNAFRTAENEYRLLAAVVHGMMQTPHVRRIESQLMLMPFAPSRSVPAAGVARIYARNFMELDLSGAEDLRERPVPAPLAVERWSERHQDSAAQLIAAAYRGHVDSEINDQYRSAAGARRFLFNIVQHPGCGAFFRNAAFVAIDRHAGRVVGICLTSIVAARVGHITQVCVHPSVRGSGIGFELIRRSLAAMSSEGCLTASLTVTSANLHAVELYDRLGFRTVRQFPAMVWDGY